MPTARTFTRAFSGGIVTPEMFGRFDLQQIAQAVADARNYVTLPHGPAQNRAGFEFVSAVGNSASRVRVIPFAYNDVQTFCIEVGVGYFRWHTQGATLLVGSTPGAWSSVTAYTQGGLVSYAGRTYYALQDGTGHQPDSSPTYWYAMPADGTYEIPNSFTEDQLFRIRYTQSADVVTLVCEGCNIQELRRLGATNWVLVDVTTTPGIAKPTGATATATGAGGIGYYYRATAVSGDNNLEESVASSTATCTNNLTVAGNYNSLACTVSSDAIRVNWYKAVSGLYGFIGSAAPGNDFIDTNITPDASLTPPTPDETFGGNVGLYGIPQPQAVGYFEQRRWFANWQGRPQNVIATRSGTEQNVAYHVPTLADDRIAFRIATREGTEIRHLVPLQNLFLLTATGVLRLIATDGGALTGATLSSKPVSSDGASEVTPVLAGSGALYAQSKGSRIRELSYSYNAQGYITSDICILAPHLFDGHTIVDMAFVRSPYPILYAVNDAGTLLGLTYVPEQRVSGWHRHDTDGTFESVCAVGELDPATGVIEDRLYVVVRRTINGAQVRYIERQRSRKVLALEDAFFVDSGITYDGPPTTTITAGLGHLEGKMVSILADGAVMPQQVVTGGGLPAPFDLPASKIHVGLPYTSQLVSLPVVVPISDYGQGRPKSLNSVHLRVNESSSIYAGPSFDALVPFKQRTDEPYGTPPRLVNDEIEIVPYGGWTTSGQVYIQQTDPLPSTIVSMTLDVTLGG